MNANYKSIILAIGLFVALPALTFAAPGDLDPTFGSGGIVITRGSTFNGLNQAGGMAIQSDGKIVVVGEGATSNTWDFAVVRYNTDGSLDSSFGGTGIVLTPVGNSNDQALSVAIQADGKIIAAGFSCGGVGTFCTGVSSFAVVRYNPNGSLDTSFNGTGKIITSVGNSGGYAHSVAIQADGKTVVAGNSGNYPNSNFAVVRYNTDGSLDTTFNGTGIVITSLGNSFDEAFSVVIQTDGKVVVAGSSYNGSNSDFAVVRYNTDGTLDTSFNGTGKVITSFGNSYDYASELAIQTDGKIVVVGSSGNASNYDFAVVRYNPNGTLDTSFGGTGKIIIPIGDFADHANSVAIQSDGKILVVGNSGNGRFNGGGADFAVVRFNPNGSLDTSFNGTGKVVTPVGNSQDYAIAAAIQADGKIVVAGATDDRAFDFYDFALVRYQGGSNANIRTRFDFDGDGKADIAVFRPTVGEWWYLRSSDGGNLTFQFGNSSDKLVPADYTGDGRTDIAFWRPTTGEWFILRSEDNSFFSFPFGTNGDIPAPADYDADGKADAAVFRPSTNTWFISRSSGGTTIEQFGVSGDVPVTADYDGDGKSDLAIFRPSLGQWWLSRSSLGVIVYQFGVNSDKPVQGDYTGDGKTDVAFFRPSTNEWFVLRSENNSFYSFPFGTAGDVPSPGDYDGDGKFDAAVFRPSNNTWFVQRSTSGTLIQTFGQTGDNPVPSAFIP